MSASVVDTPKHPVPPAIEPERTLSVQQWGMIAFLLSETAFFSTLIVTYLTFVGRDRIGPSPAEALSLPLVIGTTCCLLTSSVTIHLAQSAAEAGYAGRFRTLWGTTILLGIAFIAGTAYEWFDLITNHNLTIDRNLFGTTFYTLIGFHGLHVTLGIVALGIVFGLTFVRSLSDTAVGIELVSWYWHFVDVVWIVVFTIVYLLGGATFS